MSTNTKRQGMAIASLIVGTVSLLGFGLATGIPAIILGHIAHHRARKSPEHYHGRGLAIAGFVTGYASLITTAVLFGVVFPAFASAKANAQTIQCVTNMRQIGAAFRTWSAAHHDQFPVNISTNQGGATPLTGEALATDAVQVFRSLSAELGSPEVLVCPADRTKRPAMSFADLQPAQITYELESGPEISPSNPQEILARCPIHSLVIFCDGNVQQGDWR